MSLSLLAAAAAAALVTAGLGPAAATGPTSPDCQWRTSAADLQAALPADSADARVAQIRDALAAAQPAPNSCPAGAPAAPAAATAAAPCPVAADRPYFPQADWLWSPIAEGAKLDGASTAMAHELSSGDHILNTGDFGVALVNPDEITASTPRSSVSVSENWGPNPFAGIEVPVPAGLKIPPGSDGHVAIADPVTDTVVNLWVAKKTGSGLAANWGAATPLDGDGREHNGSSTGAGIARYASVIRAQEIADGSIPHALFFSTNVVKPGEVRYPATKTDGSNMDGAGSPIPEGARVQLDPSIDVDAIPGISKGAATIAKALQTYGAYVGDNGGARMAFIAEYAPDSDAYEKAGLSGDYVNLNSIPWDKLRVLSDWSGGTAPTPADAGTSTDTGKDAADRHGTESTADADSDEASGSDSGADSDAGSGPAGTEPASAGTPAVTTPGAAAPIVGGPPAPGTAGPGSGSPSAPAPSSSTTPGSTTPAATPPGTATSGTSAGGAAPAPNAAAPGTSAPAASACGPSTPGATAAGAPAAAPGTPAGSSVGTVPNSTPAGPAPPVTAPAPGTAGPAPAAPAAGTTPAVATAPAMERAPSAPVAATAATLEN